MEIFLLACLMMTPIVLGAYTFYVSYLVTDSNA